MDLVRKIIAAFLVISGIVVAVNLAVTPLYHDGSPDYVIWRYVNYFMAVGVVIILVVGIARKRAIGDQEVDTDTLTYLRTSFVFYGSIVLASLFFWQWFWLLDTSSETGLAVNSHLIHFPTMDLLYTTLCLMVGRRMWPADGG